MSIILCKIRASALRPLDNIIETGFLVTERIRVLTVKQLRDQTPKKVEVTITNGTKTKKALIPWDRRLLVERTIPGAPNSPSAASEPTEGTQTPSEVSNASPEPSDKVSVLIAQARERFIAELKRIFRDNP